MKALATLSQHVVHSKTNSQSEKVDWNIWSVTFIANFLLKLSFPDHITFISRFELDNFPACVNRKPVSYFHNFSPVVRTKANSLRSDKLGRGVFMMTSWFGNVLRVTVPLRREFTAYHWIRPTRIHLSRLIVIFLLYRATLDVFLLLSGLKTYQNAMKLETYRRSGTKKHLMIYSKITRQGL